MSRCYEVLWADESGGGFTVRRRKIQAGAAVVARRRASAPSDAFVREIPCNGLSGVGRGKGKRKARKATVGLPRRPRARSGGPLRRAAGAASSDRMWATAFRARS